MATRDEWLAEISQKILHSQKVYSDEPILFTANQMKNYLPEKCREMRTLAFQGGRRSLTSAEIFYKQGKFMETYEDDCPYDGEFVRYFPTYESMSDRQLRGYFTWRTRVRNGTVEKTSLSFAYVYIYELLNGIGVDDPQDGFRKLCAFREAYSRLDPQINRYLEVWLRDYVICYDLDASLLEDVADLQFDRALSVLQNWREADDDALFDAVCTLSTYQITRSRYYREQEKKTRAVLCGTIRRLSEYCEKHRKYTLTEGYFGRVFTTPYTMFYSAIVSPKPQRDRTFVVSELCSFTCKDGKWSCTRVWGKHGKNADLGAVVRAVDALLRQSDAFAHPLKTDAVPKYLHKIIHDTIDDVCIKEKQRAAREVRIDLSKLQGIRDAADATRERLIVEEEPEPEPEIAPEPEHAENELGLDDVETAFLRALLRCRSADEILRESGRMTSVVVDAINEKCFDRFGDTVLVCDGETPQILEDYEEELKEMLL
jgi:hypothetical protein